MNDILYYGSALLLALLLGSGSAWWAVKGGLRGGVLCGGWHHYPAYGSATANPYVRARTQVAGPLALDRSEAIYLIADRDERGEVLRPGRDYRIEGTDLDARWWSITAYGDDHHLIPNPMKCYSCNSVNVAKRADGCWTIHLSNSKKPGNWIPTGKGKRLELFLRMYNPAPAVLEDVRSVNAPRIIREDLTDE